MGIRYPKYVFLTYGMYDPQWWISQDNHSGDECSSEDIAHTLQYSLAVSHFNALLMNNIPYHVCYDAVFSLAYALQKVIQNGGSDATILSMDNMNRSDYRQCRYTSTLSLRINKQLRNTNFTGNSVSTDSVRAPSSQHNHHIISELVLFFSKATKFFHMPIISCTPLMMFIFDFMPCSFQNAIFWKV